MEIFFLNDKFYLTDGLTLVTHICFTISIFFLSTTVVIYLLNLPRLKWVKYRTKYPQQHSSSLLLSLCMTVLICWQVLVIIIVSRKNFADNKILQGLIIFTSMVFYIFHIALLLRMLHMTVYWQKSRGNPGIRPVYCLVLILPLIIMTALVLESYFHRGPKHWPGNILFIEDYTKFVMVALQIVTLCFNFVICIIVLFIRVSNLRKTDLGVTEIIKRLKQADVLRNRIVMFFWLCAVLPCNILSTRDELSKAQIVTIIILHSFLGPLYFLSWFVFFNKEFRKPFRFQHQKELRQRTLQLRENWL